MATITRYVNTASTAGGDGTTNATTGTTRAYASLNEWEAAEQADLVTAGDIHVVYCEGSVADTAVLNILGWTTGAGNYISIIVTAANRHNGTRSSTKYRHETSTDWVNSFAVSEDYVRLEGLQFKGGGLGSNALTVNVGTSDIRITDCLAYDSTGSGFAINAANVVQFINCAAFGNTGQGFWVGSGGTVVAYAYNCVSVNNGAYGFFCSDWRTLNAKNCYAGGNTTADFGKGTNGTLNLTTCHTADTTGDTQTAFSTSSGAYFTNVTSGSEDLNISTSSALKDTGTDLSADTYWVHPDGDVDIIGTARPASAWDVGAFEFLAAGGGLSIPVAMHHYNQMRI